MGGLAGDPPAGPQLHPGTDDVDLHLAFRAAFLGHLDGELDLGLGHLEAQPLTISLGLGIRQLPPQLPKRFGQPNSLVFPHTSPLSHTSVRTKHIPDKRWMSDEVYIAGSHGFKPHRSGAATLRVRSSALRERSDTERTERSRHGIRADGTQPSPTALHQSEELNERHL